MNSKKLGKRIKEIRESIDMSQKKLSELTGISNVYISNLENGTKDNPSLELIQKIADTLNCSIDTLVKTNIVGENLRRIRKSKGLSQIKLSELSGVHNTYINRIEKGVYENPSLDILEKLANALNRSVEALTGTKEETTDYKKAIIKIANNDNDFEGVANSLTKRLIEEGIIKADKEIDKETLKMIEDAIKLDAKLHDNLKKKGSK